MFHLFHLSRPEIGLQNIMKQMEQEKEKKKEVVEEYLRGGESLRELGKRRGVSAATIHRWVREHKEKKGLGKVEGCGEKRRHGMEARDTKMPGDVRRLQKELEEARLYNKLLNAMIDIAEEEFEIPIRKKHGAKR